MPSPDLAVRLLQRADGMLDPGERVYMESLVRLLAPRALRPTDTAIGRVSAGLVIAASNLLEAAADDPEPDEWSYALLLADVVRLYGKTCLLAAPS